ncbi:No mechanoreceptor potential C [Strongyloides ratti]|uniref:No mechanoreceptor potential C n=1 Tax=Strongyloides ratti TaxID=34506 RepID=A0A090MYR6_STRRB|nr:No mechanoreceptor potential C [Strongyloides ratti]CEF67649.1 No mechanoreceptor potential C [Strongyloides ratti]
MPIDKSKIRPTNFIEPSWHPRGSLNKPGGIIAGAIWSTLKNEENDKFNTFPSKVLSPRTGIIGSALKKYHYIKSNKRSSSTEDIFRPGEGNQKDISNSLEKLNCIERGYFSYRNREYGNKVDWRGGIIGSELEKVRKRTMMNSNYMRKESIVSEKNNQDNDKVKYFEEKRFKESENELKKYSHIKHEITNEIDGDDDSNEIIENNKKYHNEKFNNVATGSFTAKKVENNIDDSFSIEDLEDVISDTDDNSENEKEEKTTIEPLTSDVKMALKLIELSKNQNWTEIDKKLNNHEKIKLSHVDENGKSLIYYLAKYGPLKLLEKLISIDCSLINFTTPDNENLIHAAVECNEAMIVKSLILKDVPCNIITISKKYKPLHLAVQRTDHQALSIVDILIKYDPKSLISQDYQGNLPIHICLKTYARIDMISRLLQLYIEEQMNIEDDDGNNALHLSASKNHQLFSYMCSHNCMLSINKQNKKGETPFHFAARIGDDQMLKSFYKLDANVNICDNKDISPLHIAAELGHTSFVERLIDKFGASLTARTRDGDTLLHIAAYSGHASTALAFLKRGVPLNMPNKKGALGLHTAAAAGFNEVVKMLLAKGTHIDIKTKDNFTALHIAVKNNKPEVVETLIGFGADVHLHGGKNGETPLHVAANSHEENAIDCALMLLKSGAQPNVRMNDGQTSLHVAAKQGIEKMILLLLEEDADPTLVSNNGETPLHIAVRYCNYRGCYLIINYLKEKMSDIKIASYVNIQSTTEGKSTIHYAAEITPDQCHYQGEEADIVKLLLKFGASPELQTTLTGETAMHLVARSGNESVILALVNTIGVGMVQIIQNKQSKSGWAPLLEACARGHLGVAQILLKHHARIDVFDELGRTCLHLAAMNGHVQLTHMLLRNKAFVNSKTKSGESPLHLASQFGHTKVATVLLQDYGASIEAITLDNQTALHYAAKFGQLGVAQALLAFGANPSAKDDKGQTPLHLAAENDYPDVVKLFLKMKQNNRQVLTAIDGNGFTCAHIAAMKGSYAVVKELMMIDKKMVLNAKTKTMEATALHMASAGGHTAIVKVLLKNGANSEDENAHGMTPLLLGAKNGHVEILEAFDEVNWKRCSKKTGLNALHIAAYYGNTDFVIAMLKKVPANVRSEPPIYNHLVVKEFATEYGLTPLHLAAQSGHDGLVRMLLNQTGVQVDATSTTMNVIPLHLAAQQGHIAVVGMLLSRSTQQQHAKDWRGRTPLHLASMNGHYEMVSLLIAQGSNINVMDQNGWTGMHYATKAGHLDVVKLFINSSADAQAETKEGKVPLCFAAANNHIECLRYLLRQKHDTHSLMEDRKFIFDLMVCGKNTENEPLQLFILQSPAPIDTAVKLSSLFREMSEKEKERAKDLLNVSIFAEEMAVELLGITASEYNPAILLKAKDYRGRPLLDVLIENEQKEVVSYASVQRYLTEIWTGRVEWSFGKTVAFALFVFICPPAWFYFSLPLDTRIGRAPIIKFVCHIVSHVYFTILLTIVVLNITHKIYETTSVMPNYVEWILLIWLSGNLVSELSNVGGSSGLGIVKVLILILAAAAIAVHILAFLLPAFYFTNLDNDEKLHFARTMLYLKNQLFAFSLLFAFIQYLDFLTVHHLFGPWAIIIRDLMYDLTRFLVILMLFIAGFTLHVTSIFQPAYQPVDDESSEFMRLYSPAQTLEMLFFSLFGLVEPDNMPPLHLVPEFAKIILKLLFGIYMMVTLIVLINLLIAMMSDTYQRIQAQSDKEWKFGRAILIRKMNKRAATPSPINMLTKFFIVMKVAWRNKLKVCTPKAQHDLRYEENIDAFSMTDGNGINYQGIGSDTGLPEDEERATKSYSIESVVDWRRIVQLYYQSIAKNGSHGFEGDENREE